MDERLDLEAELGDPIARANQDDVIEALEAMDGEARNTDPDPPGKGFGAEAAKLATLRTKEGNMDKKERGALLDIASGNAAEYTVTELEALGLYASSLAGRTDDDELAREAQSRLDDDA